MNKFLRIIIFLFLLCTSFTNSNSQSISRSVIANAAETLIRPELSLTFVVGETVGDLFSNPSNNKYLTAGFPQPDVELKSLLDLNINNKITIFPNPATSLVKIGLDNIPDATYTIDLVDMAGRVLQSNQVPFSNNNQLYITMNVAPYASGMYIIRVRSDKQYNGQAKLIKR
jgi:hypothetical protein